MQKNAKKAKDDKKKAVRRLRSTIRKLVAQAMASAWAGAEATPKIEEHEVDLICEKFGERDSAVADLEALLASFGEVTHGEGGVVTGTDPGLKSGCEAVVEALAEAKA